MKRTRRSSARNTDHAADPRTTLSRARELADALQGMVKDATRRGPTPLDAEIVARLWNAWMGGTRGKHPRRYLMRLILLEKRARADKRAATELTRRLTPGELRVHMPSLPAGKGAESRLRQELSRLSKLEPRGRGRPRKGEPKPRFYAEVLRALPRLGMERVTQRQLMRDYQAAVVDERWGRD